MKVLVTLGYFDESGEGAIVEVDLARETQQPLVRFTPPDWLRVPSKGFTGATWVGAPRHSDLVVCGFNALYRFSGPQLEHTGTLHQPCMNDLHHVACDGERLWVANSGLDSIDVYSVLGKYLGGYRTQPDWIVAERIANRVPSRSAWASLTDPGWKGDPPSFTPEVPTGHYYEASDATVPHHKRVVRDFVHPNHIALVGAQVLVTRLQDRAVIDVAALRPVITDAPGHPHDGERDGDLFWITCVDGVVAGYAVEGERVTGRLVRQLNIFESTGHTGWCRGLLVTAEHFIVGLTEIRRTPRYRWSDSAFEETETSILCIEKRTGRLQARVLLAERERHPKVFDVLAASPT